MLSSTAINQVAEVCGDGISSSLGITTFPLSEVFLPVTTPFIGEALIPI